MTYGLFLVVFLLPPIAVLLARQPRPLAGVGGARARWALPLTCLVAFVYTTPWDNYLVYRGVWGYGPERVIGTIGYVPIEEYLFFLLQPVMTGLFLYRLLGREGAREETPASTSVYSVVALLFAAITGVGVWCLLAGGPRALYLGLILAWAGPVLAGMWAFAGRTLWRWRRAGTLALAVPTLYLWVADRIAIGLGIWYIEPALSLPFRPLGLPVEEATFFLVTNLLVVLGVLLFLHGDRIAADRAARRRNFSPTRS